MNEAKRLLIDLLEYHTGTNQTIISHIQDYSDKISERAHDLISHTLVAHQIWNNRINSACEAPFSLEQIIPLYMLSQVDRKNTENSLAIVRQFSLDENISYRNSSGDAFENSVGEILIHISNHTSHHRGQLMMELRSCGIPTIATDYIFSKRT